MFNWRHLIGSTLAPGWRAAGDQHNTELWGLLSHYTADNLMLLSVSGVFAIERPRASVAKLMYSTVFILWREVKCCLSPREIPKAEPEEIFKGVGYILMYIPTRVIIQTLSISKNYSSRIVLPCSAIWKSWFSILLWQLGIYFPLSHS